ncbi:flagellar basal body P-ring formation chaperone FlgA [Alteromonas aestuariivivens]|nr:flagellar basal body P-ring formation chaperone FlgA [Alteromonas aestuariivivens]
MLIFLTPATALAVEPQTRHEHLSQGAQQYLQQAIGTMNEDDKLHIDMVAIDSRISIPDCPTGFQYHVGDEALLQSYLSVRVSCANNDWYLFTNARITRTRSVVVTSGMISPGTLLTSQNLELADIEVNRLRHTAFTNIKDLIGARMKHRVRPGQPIQTNMLCFVCKGDRITISAGTNVMRVKTAGIAQQDGVIGDTIEVINAQSQKSVIAEVASTQEVVVNL